jgi:ribosome-binding factor A
MISITEVEISPDYHYAKVFVSVLGSEEEHDSTLTALSAAASFIRRELRTRLKSLRHVPELNFKLDRSIENGARLSALLNQVAQEEAPTSGSEHREER